MYLAEFNFIGLFENLGWCWRFPTNIFQVENSKNISDFDKDYEVNEERFQSWKK